MNMDYIRYYLSLSSQSLKNLEKLKTECAKDKTQNIQKTVENKILEEKIIIRILTVLIAAEAVKFDQIEDNFYEQ